MKLLGPFIINCQALAQACLHPESEFPPSCGRALGSPIVGPPVRWLTACRPPIRRRQRARDTR
jgi:hypothetical protein